jgi:histidinol-phosphate aminotransferase
VIKLASNENPLGPSPRVIDTLNRTQLDLHSYPDYDGWYLRQEIARLAGVGMDSVLLGAGSAELMRLIAEVYLGTGSEALVGDLCFPVYANVARLAGAKVVEVPVDQGFCYDLERMLEAVSANTSVVFLATPNNPTGRVIAGSDLNLFLEKLSPNVLCVLDLAYHDYVAPEQKLRHKELLERFSNVVLLRTFSKVYGLAGLRIGYAVAAGDVVAALSRVRIPFTTSTPAQVAGLVALGDPEHKTRSVALNASMRAHLSRELEGLGLHTYPSSANFVLVDSGVDSETIFQEMLRRGVVVRPLRHPRLSRFLRITTGTEEEMELATGALAEVLAGHS